MNQQSRPATRIRTIRKQQELTLKQLAAAIGTTPQTAQRLETDNMTVSMKWLEKIAVALRVRVADLLAPDDQPPTPEEVIMELIRIELIRARRTPMDKSALALVDANGKLAAAQLGAQMGLHHWQDVAKRAATVAACAIRIALDGEPQVAQPTLALVREAG